MATRTKTREITIVEEKGTFSTLFKRLYGESDEYNYEGIAALRHLLSNEKARLLHVVKTRAPSSLYQLSRLLNRDFKAVTEDVKLLQRFGCIDLVEEKVGKRKRLKPVILLDTLRLEIKF